MKKLALGLLWLVGSAATISVAWAGVSVVDNEIIHPPGASSGSAASVAVASETPAAEVEVAPEDIDRSDDESASEPDTAADRSSSDDASDSGREPEASPGGADETPAPTTVAPSTPTTLPPPATTIAPAPTTTQPAPPTTTIAPVPTVAPTTTVAPAQTLTFTLIGGTTAISFSAEEVEVLWATPNPGFVVEIEPDPPEMKVKFESPDHDSRIEAWWAAGPQYEIREEPEG